MAISRVPGYSLLANLDRQGTDLALTSSGLTLQYWDVVNYRIGVNTDTPLEALHVNGNILTGNGHIYSGANLQFDIGSIGNQWRTGYFGNVTGTILTADQPFITNVGPLGNLTVTGSLTVGNINLSNLVINGNSIINAGNNRIIYVADPINSSDAATKAYVDQQVVGTNYGNLIPLGDPTDGNIRYPGAWAFWSNTTLVTDAIDDLNEMMENVRANTFVKSVTFTGAPTAGGAGTTVTLTIVPTGTANRYDIAWGDGTYSNASVTTSPTHTYNDNTNSPFDLTVRAYNSAGLGTGSEASFERIDYIIIYTADPNVQFDLYRASSGGSALTGNNLYVIEGNAIYLQNTTTNTTMATVAYQMNWGDGTSNVAIANDSASGGVLGSRLAYTPSYTASSGATTNTMRLFLTSHTTANPSVIPRANIANVKVYDANISSPAGLNTKTLSFSGSVGTNATLAASATDNTGGTTLAANASVSRTVATGTTLVTTSGNVTTNYSYNANVGYLQAVVNGTVRGNANVASTSAGITGNLGVIGFSDFWLLTSAGASTTFAASTYYPGAFWGFTANVVAQGGSIPVGINRFGLNHSSTGIVANVEFVKDDVTSVPTVTAGTLAIKAPGTYRYISGIPYFNTGSPQLWWQNITINSWIGQTWNNTSNVAYVVTGTVKEGSSGNAILANSHAYVNLSNISSPMLASGTPVAGTGNVSAYNAGNLTVAINQASVRSVANLRIVVTNVNGTSAYVETGVNVQVHTASQSGISEIAISANTSANTNPAVRSTYFLASTSHTPSYVSSTNFMTTPNVYTEASDPGVAGTREATIRIGVLKWSANNYSTGYLPVGPDRSADGTSYQYFTMGLQRSGVSGFNLHLVAPAGIAGLWVAAPGTYIDQTSSLNGWLDATTSYAGSGRPGANTGSGGNGSNGCGTGALVSANVALSGTFAMTLGNVSLSSATNNVALVRIALASGQTVSTLAVS